jgi:hypothetical protein
MAPSSARATTLNRSAATKDAVSLFERYPERGDDQKKEWADKMLPTLRHHLEMPKRRRPEKPSEGASACQRGYRTQLRVSRNRDCVLNIRDYILNISGFLAMDSSHSSRIIP